jgi:fatty acid amide hydrolase
MGINLTKLQEANQARIQEKLFVDGAKGLNFTPDQLRVCELPANLLRKLLLSQESDITLPDLVKRFHFKKQQLANKDKALVEVLFDRPVKRAEELQEIIDRNDKNVIESLPLLGFIMSIKDSIVYEGTDCTFGFQEFVNKPYSATSKIIAFLESKGAIVTCKGNVPQALMMIESHSTAFGNVRNPFDSSRSAGGSSGGEGALIANRLVNSSIGSDIGGSVRIPALFCGVYSLKPTAGRFVGAEAGLFENTSQSGKTPEHQPLVSGTIGPMTNDIDDLEILASQMNAYGEFDVNIPPLPWTKAEIPLRVGIIKPFDNFIELCQSTRRAQQEAVEALRSTNIEIVEIDLTDIVEEMATLMYVLFLKDKGLSSIYDDYCDIQEPLHQAYTSMSLLNSLDSKTLKNLIDENEGLSREVVTYKAALIGRENNYLSLMIKQRKLIDEVIGRFRRADVEVAVAPGLFPAVKIGTSDENSLSCAYTFIWNYINFPVGAIPITKVRESEQAYKSEFDDRLTDALKLTLKNSEGLPVGVQIAALPWKDELVVETMKIIDKFMKHKRE